MYTYTYSNGEVVHYYIDNEDHEYLYKNGEKIYVLLPLNKYRTTDEKALQAEELITIAEPPQILSEPYSSSDNYVVIATLFKSVVNLPDI